MHACRVHDKQVLLGGRCILPGCCITLLPLITHALPAYPACPLIHRGHVSLFILWLSHLQIAQQFDCLAVTLVSMEGGNHFDKNQHLSAAASPASAASTPTCVLRAVVSPSIPALMHSYTCVGCDYMLIRSVKPIAVSVRCLHAGGALQRHSRLS